MTQLALFLLLLGCDTIPKKLVVLRPFLPFRERETAFSQLDRTASLKTIWSNLGISCSCGRGGKIKKIDLETVVHRYVRALRGRRSFALAGSLSKDDLFREIQKKIV